MNIIKNYIVLLVFASMFVADDQPQLFSLESVSLRQPSTEELSGPIIVTLEEPISDPINDVNIERRAAFDCGGGGIRLLVADVDVTQNKVIRKLLNANVKIGFRESLSPDSNVLSKEIEKIAAEVLRDLRQRAEAYQPVLYVGVATEAFRKADNGKKFITNLSKDSRISLKTIDQETEGKIGFLSRVSNNSTLPEKSIVVDVGSGSLQISSLENDKTFDIFEAKLGKFALNEILFQIRDKKLENSINPVTPEEALLLSDILIEEFKKMSNQLKAKFKADNVKIIIGSSFMDEEKKWGKDEAWEALCANVLNRDDSQLEKPNNTSKAILYFALLKGLDIDECEIIKNEAGGEGNTLGILVSEEFWH